MRILIWSWRGSLRAWPASGLALRTLKSSKKKPVARRPRGPREGTPAARSQRQQRVSQAEDDPAELLCPTPAAAPARRGRGEGRRTGPTRAALPTASGYPQVVGVVAATLGPRRSEVGPRPIF